MGKQDLKLEQLFVECRGRLAAVARRQTASRFDRRFDPDDVVQSVFRTLLRRSEEGTVELTSKANAWALLKKVTIAKSLRAIRRNSAQKRDVRMEQLVGSNGGFIADQQNDSVDTLLQEMLTILARTASPMELEVLEMKASGHTVKYIADNLEVSQQTIYRQLRSLEGQYDRAQSS